MSSFLRARQQRVKLSEILSDWMTLNGDMPQGSYLGHMIFILLINDLRSWLHMHKFIDDTTLSEIILKGSETDMQRALDAVLEWSHLNYMNINCKKTKEIVLGSFSKARLCLLNACQCTNFWASLLTRLSNGTTMLLPSNPKQQNDFGFLRNLSVPVFQLTTLYITS